MSDSEEEVETLPAEVTTGDGAQVQKRRPSPIQQAAQPRSLQEIKEVAQILYESGFFNDIRNASQATAKILAGAELGLDPMESMRSVHAFDGKTSLHYSQVLALIRRSEQYDYEIVESTEKRAEIIFYRFARGEWREEGTQTWTMEDAEKAGLTGKNNWKSYPRAMLLGRAATEGQRKFCPDVGGGPLYTPEEMGAQVDEDGKAIAPPQKNQQKGSRGPSPAAKMMTRMKNLLGSKPAWLVEAVIGYQPQKPSELTDDQVSDVEGALDTIEAVLNANTIGDPLAWLGWCYNHDGISIPGNLPESVEEYQAQTSNANGGSDDRSPVEKSRAYLQKARATGDAQKLSDAIDTIRTRAEEALEGDEADKVKRCVIPFEAVGHLRASVKGDYTSIDEDAFNRSLDWFAQQTDGWPGDELQWAQAVVHDEAKQLAGQVPGFSLDVTDEEGPFEVEDSTGSDAVEAMQNGETALDPDSGEDSESEPNEAERQWGSPQDAIQSHFDVALKHGDLNHIPEEDQISGGQLNQMYAIANDEGWKDTWLDRMVKDEVGYESKSVVPSGKAYEEVIDALESDEMRFWMSRDPDTGDLFEQDKADENS